MRTSSALADELASAIRLRLNGRSAPLLVALDGPGGAGKSTLARTLESRIDVAVIEGDDFYAGGTAQEWDAMAPLERVDRCIDWRRQRRVLATLREGKVAEWHGYDWQVDDGRLTEVAFTLAPRPVVVLEGVYSARPELAGVLDLRVLLATSTDVAARRLREREGARYRSEWEPRWRSAEVHYFSTVMPSSSFDVVLEP